MKYSFKDVMSNLPQSETISYDSILYDCLGPRNVRELNKILPASEVIQGAGGNVANLDDLVGQKFAFSTITGYSKGRTGLTINFKTEYTIINDSKSADTAEDENDPYNIRVIQPEKFEIFLGLYENGNLRFSLTRAIHDRDYGHLGYQHIADSACLGTWLETFEQLYIAGEVPFATVMATINMYLVHRNEHDVAGEWMKYRDTLSTRKAQNVEGYVHDSELIHWINQAEGRVFPWGQVTKKELTDNITKYVSECKERNCIRKDDKGVVEQWISQETE